MESDGSNQQYLTTGLHYDSSPSWSPDGTEIAFGSDRDTAPATWTLFNIFTMNPDGSNQTNRTNSSSSNVNIAWSPDSKRIAVMYHHFGNGHISIIDVDTGKEINYLDINKWYHQMEFSPDGTEIIAEGDIIDIK